MEEIKILITEEWERENIESIMGEEEFGNFLRSKPGFNEELEQLEITIKKVPK